MVERIRSWSSGRRWGILVLAIAVCAGGVYGFKHYKKSKAGDGGPSTLAQAATGDIEVHFMDSGELAPKHSVDLASKVSGRVIELPVDEGSRVSKGQLLAVIQPGRTEAEHYVPVSLTSPLDGVVMRYQKKGYNNEESTFARLGDYVTGLMESNQPTYLMTLADLHRLIVKMKISEMDILKLREGMKVTVTVDALPDEKFPAQVTLVSPQAEKDQNNLKNFKVEVSLQKNDPRLKPGMTARVDGLLEARKGVLKIPIAAIFEEKGKSMAYVHDPAAKPKKIEVKLGLRNETDVEVKNGLKAGDKVHTEKPAEEKKS